ncbi:MAG: hypothetical protein ACI87E_005186 [Mariniblastus sp.]|jgi:hypothetical protein
MHTETRSFRRRLFLKSAFATLTLPAMEAIVPKAVAADVGYQARTESRRLVCIGNSFGMYQPKFFPKEAGKNYQITPLLKPIERHRNDFTVFSNLDHGIKGGHFAVHSFLSGVQLDDAKAMPNGNISVDQRAAEMIGARTRFPSLTIGSTDGLHGGCKMCWTRTGVRVPPIEGPRELFRKMFVDVNASKKAESVDRFRLQGSILDALQDEASSLGRRVSGRDRKKLEEYFSSVRDVEKRIQQQENWHSIPKPKASIEEPANENLIEDIPDLYELIAIALETDATRIACLELAGAGFKTGILGLQKGYHSYSHHGMDSKNIEGLVKLELYQMSQFSKFLDRLKAIETPDGNGNLLDQTSVLFGSGMGNANSHTNKDLPVILAGGGYELGEHRVLPKEKKNRVRLCNLLLSLLHRMGVEDESFGTSNGVMTGLELRA